MKLFSKFSNDQLAILIVAVIVSFLVGIFFLAQAAPMILGITAMSLIGLVYLVIIFYAVKRTLELYRK